MSLCWVFVKEHWCATAFNLGQWRERVTVMLKVTVRSAGGLKEASRSGYVTFVMNTLRLCLPVVTEIRWALYLCVKLTPYSTSHCWLSPCFCGHTDVSCCWYLPLFISYSCSDLSALHFWDTLKDFKWKQNMSSYSQELLEAVLYAPLVDGEESSSDLVDGLGQAVDVVTVSCRGQQTHTVTEGTRHFVCVWKSISSALISDMCGSLRLPQQWDAAEYRTKSCPSRRGEYGFVFLFFCIACRWTPLRVNVRCI